MQEQSIRDAVVLPACAQRYSGRAAQPIRASPPPQAWWSDACWVHADETTTVMHTHDGRTEDATPSFSLPPIAAQGAASFYVSGGECGPVRRSKGLVSRTSNERRSSFGPHRDHTDADAAGFGGGSVAGKQSDRREWTLHSHEACGHDIYCSATGGCACRRATRTPTLVDMV